MLWTDSTQVAADHKALAGTFESWWRQILLALVEDLASLAGLEPTHLAPEASALSN
jgi:hypothetical protein